MKKTITKKCLAFVMAFAMIVTLCISTTNVKAASSMPKFSKTYKTVTSNVKYTIKNVKKGQKVKVRLSGSGAALANNKKAKTLKVKKRTVSFTVNVNKANFNGQKIKVTATVYKKNNKKVKTLTTSFKLPKNTAPVGKNTIRQVSATSFVMTLTNPAGSVSASQISMENVATHVVCPIKDAKVSSANANEVTFETYNGVTDGGTYKVTFNNITLTIQVSNGVVRSFSVDPVTIPCATATTINLITKDQNGIILEKIPYGSAQAANYQFKLSTNQGYTSGAKLYLYNQGNTAVATASYNGATPLNTTIVAGPKQTAAITGYQMHIDENGRSFQSAQNHELCVNESKTAYFRFLTNDGKEITSYNNYKVESSDKNKLLVGTFDSSKHSVAITAVSAGTAYILVKDSDGKVVASIDVQIKPAKQVTRLECNPAQNLTLSTADKKAKVVTVKAKDQYNTDVATAVAKGRIQVICTDHGSSSKYQYASTATNTVDGQISFDGTKFAAGEYTYKITVANQTYMLKVIVKAPANDGSSSYKLNISSTSADTAVNNKADATKNIAISVEEYRGEVLSGYVTSKTKNASNFNISLKLNGKDVNSDYFSFDKTKETNTFRVTYLNGDKVVKTPAGTYDITVTFGSVTLTDKITITDTQAPVTVKAETLKTAKADNATVITKAFSFTYNGKTYSNSGISGAVAMSSSDVTDIKSTTLGNQIHFTSATVYLNVDNVKVPFQVTLDKTVEVA